MNLKPHGIQVVLDNVRQLQTTVWFLILLGVCNLTGVVFLS
jgi:hypothetical protein